MKKKKKLTVGSRVITSRLHTSVSDVCVCCEFFFFCAFSAAFWWVQRCNVMFGGNLLTCCVYHWVRFKGGRFVATQKQTLPTATITSYDRLWLYPLPWNQIQAEESLAHWSDDLEREKVKRISGVVCETLWLHLLLGSYYSVDSLYFLSLL